MDHIDVGLPRRLHEDAVQPLRSRVARHVLQPLVHDREDLAALDGDVARAVHPELAVLVNLGEHGLQLRAAEPEGLVPRVLLSVGLARGARRGLRRRGVVCRGELGGEHVEKGQGVEGWVDVVPELLEGELR